MSLVLENRGNARIAGEARPRNPFAHGSAELKIVAGKLCFKGESWIFMIYEEASGHRDTGSVLFSLVAGLLAAPIPERFSGAELDCNTQRIEIPGAFKAQGQGTTKAVFEELLYFIHLIDDTGGL